ncbi:sensor histidine kinase [Jeotgalibacillus malaysiensis]|uniref:cache domain-containing sensor histidine kinase n=1 Tax=Jeotgalibacillus malaysiensis TaxID=1508404 RepID=UPI00384F7F39
MIFKKLIEAFRSLSLVKKLIITYTILTILPMAGLGLLAYYQYSQSIQLEVGKYVPQVVSQVNDNIESEIQTLTDLPELIYNSGDVMSVLRSSSPTLQSEQRQDQYIVENYLERTYLSQPDILGTFIVSKNRVFSKTNLPFQNFGFQDGSLPYRSQANQIGDAQLLLSDQLPLSFEGDPQYFLIMKSIKDFDNRRDLGVIYIAVNSLFFEKYIGQLMEEQGATVKIVNESGQIVYHSDHSQIGQTDLEINDYPITNGSFRTFEGSDSNLVSIDRSELFSMDLIHYLPVRSLTASAEGIKNVTILIFVIFAVATTMITIASSISFTKPINELGKIMGSVKRKDLNVEVPEYQTKELAVLSASFQQMLVELRELINEKYDIELKQKTAELYALQSQINPHFMYNTLETISMAVEEEETEEVVTMLTLLGRMLRFSLSNKSSLVKLQEELQHIEDYLTLQHFRFIDRLTFNITKSSHIEDYLVPKFILQPIVENAIKHGLEKSKSLLIDIEVREEVLKKREVVFTIRDNGPGMDDEVKLKIEEELKDNPLAGRDSGFGIVNVNARLAMIFGEGYSLIFNSTKGKGTEIEIRFPKVE